MSATDPNAAPYPSDALEELNAACERICELEAERDGLAAVLEITKVRASEAESDRERLTTERDEARAEHKKDLNEYLEASHDLLVERDAERQARERAEADRDEFRSGYLNAEADRERAEKERDEARALLKESAENLNRAEAGAALLKQERDEWHAMWAAVERERDEARAELKRYSMSAGEADQRMAESRFVREALGLSAESDDVAPADLVDRIMKLEAERDEARAERDKAHRPQWACHGCGRMGDDFRLIRHHTGEHDVECPECGSDETDEVSSVLRRVVLTLDTAEAERDEARATLEEVRSGLYKGVNEEATLLWAWLRANFPNASGSTPSTFLLTVKADMDGLRSVAEARHHELEQARDSLESERQARESAEDQRDEARNARDYLIAALRGVESNAAAMRAALEKSLKANREGLGSGHACKCNTAAIATAETALSSDAGAGLLAFARAAKAALVRSVLDHHEDCEYFECPDEAEKAGACCSCCEACRHTSMQADEALALAAPIEGLLRGGGT